MIEIGLPQAKHQKCPGATHDDLGDLILPRVVDLSCAVKPKAVLVRGDSFAFAIQKIWQATVRFPGQSETFENGWFPPTGSLVFRHIRLQI